MSPYLWQPIDDLPENWSNLRSSQLEVLINAWKNRVQQLQDSTILETFKDSLRSEWLSEVDMLEYLYSTDRGTTIVITRHDRQEYINASEAADSGDLTRLINLFSRLQEKILIKGLGLRA
jgi:hypothetical protein